MLTDEEARDLMDELKKLKSNRTVKYPGPGSSKSLDVYSIGRRYIV